jgi:hypothetical protein
MSVIPTIFSGMTGKSDAKVVVPSCGLINEQLTNKDPQLGRVEYEKAPNILNSAIDYSTARGVLPCIGLLIMCSVCLLYHQVILCRYHRVMVQINLVD